MRTVEEIVEEVKLLSPQERLRLIEKIDHLGQSEGSVADESQLAALDTFLALAGTADTIDTLAITPCSFLAGNTARKGSALNS